MNKKQGGCKINYIISQLQPKRPDYWFWIIVAVIVFMVLVGRARAEQEPDWEKIIPVIAQIESGGNKDAYNPHTQAAGLMQITPIVYAEYIQTVKLSSFPQLFNSKDNLDIGYWYLNRIWFHYLPHYKIPQTINNMLWAYNAGIGNVVKRIKPKETRNYIKKFWKLYKKE